MKLSELSKSQHVEIGNVMQNTHIGSSILATDRVSDAVELIAQTSNNASAQGLKSALVVLTPEGLICGIITEKDIIIALDQLGPQALDASIKTIMTEPPIVGDVKDNCEKILLMMINGNFRNVPILKKNEFVGIAQILEVAKVKMAKLIEENSKLKKLLKRVLPSELSFSPQDDISEAKAAMVSHDVPCIVLEENNQIEGIITHRDFLRLEAKTNSGQASPSIVNPTLI